MKLPDFVKVKAFWEAVSYVASGLLALLVFFGKIPADYALPPAAVLMIFLSVLHFLHIDPEMRLRELNKFLQELENESDRLEL